MTTQRTTWLCNRYCMQVAGTLLATALMGLSSGTKVPAAEKSVHWHHAGAMPPGAIGRQRLLRGGPLSTTCQPVEIRAPQGARIAPAAGDTFLEVEQSPLLVGLSIGPVYRFRVTEIPHNPGVEVFPTVELIDRLYPPVGQARRFPVPIELTQEELELAAAGSFVTRVIYLEDPELAPALKRQKDEQDWIEARPGDDPLVVADQLGRPMAILRMGGRVPTGESTDPSFTYGGPQPFVLEKVVETRPTIRHDPRVEQAVPNDGFIYTGDAP